ncbi:hypothetical protein CKAH01_09689 [Colletotrichum kahawae]|uniref:NACHT domain-containing protein n=1 Tax=Colletotrichum kahawae TaxID=34407 RepID=A0AAD9XZL2_COLKA|nr:hypothetical protein CKAH01_09689 [Colletotrichum kahawae]
MEALAAVSLAGNILQFLQFCAGLVSESRQIYDSIEGTTKDCKDLEEVCRKKQSGLLRHLEQLQGAKLTLVHDHSAKLNEIEALVRDVSFEAKTIMSNKDDSQVLLESLSAQLKAISSLSERQWISEHKVVHSLYYESLSVRHEAIPSAHSQTFNWILSKKSKCGKGIQYPKVTLRKWLRKGEGIYWVSGKPGSGKFTLMKYIADHTEALASLKEWAGPRECVVAAYYFWNAGTRLQKTVEGLLRSLLFDIFSSHPELIPAAAPPDRLANTSSKSFGRQYRLYGDEIVPTWTINEMLSTLHKLSNIDTNMPRFCLFVDGLDEYHGDPKEVVRILQTLACGKNFKLCVSSRPWNVFEDSLGLQESQKLYLHELTRHDIHQYISSTLQEDHSWKLEAISDARYTNLIEQITTKAQGVFLWVVLVVRSVLEGLSNSDSIQLLEKRIEQIPRDLGPFFRHILQSIEPIYHKQMALYFQVALDAAHPLTLMHYSFLDDCIEYDHPGLDAAVKPMDDHDIFHRQFSMRRRLNARCKGLLEDHLNPSEKRAYLAHGVEFLHRTVRDFLRTEEMRDFIKDILGDYPVDTSVLMAYISFIKALPSETPAEPFIKQAMAYASRAEKEMAKTAVEYVDQLSDIVELCSPSPTSPSIARLSIQNCLCVYVSECMDAGLSGFDDPSKLLQLAIEASASSDPDQMDLTEMISLLLARGAMLDDEKWGYLLYLLSTAVRSNADSNVAFRHLGVLKQLLPVTLDVNSHYLMRLSWLPLLTNVVEAELNSASRSLIDARLSMIQVLFSNGAQPNAAYNQRVFSVWTWFCCAVRLKYFQNSEKALSSDAPQTGQHGVVLCQEMLGRIMQIMVEAGANLQQPESLSAGEISSMFPARIAGQVNETIRQYSRIGRWRTDDIQTVSWRSWITSWFWGKGAQK